eukprot:COSAG06_NODE_1288_length_9990_cov_17.463351_2_plen_342_part_00
MQSGFTTAMDLGADGPDRGTTVDEPASSHTGYSDRKHFFMEAHAPALEQHSLTPAQRFLLDNSGYLHIPAALSASETQHARSAVEAALDGPDADDAADEVWHSSRAMERLCCFHPAVWPAVMELTNGKPKLWEGGVRVDDARRGLGCDGGTLHCGRDDWGPESATFHVNDGQIRASDFVVFIYLTDVLAGDGGLGVLPGTHKSQFQRPDEMFGAYSTVSRKTPRRSGEPSLVRGTQRRSTPIFLRQATIYQDRLWIRRLENKRALSTGDAQGRPRPARSSGVGNEAASREPATYQSESESLCCPELVLAPAANRFSSSAFIGCLLTVLLRCCVTFLCLIAR